MFEFPKPSGRWEDGDTAVKALVLSIKDDATYEPTEAWEVQTSKTNQPVVATQTMFFFHHFSSREIGEDFEPFGRSHIFQRGLVKNHQPENRHQIDDCFGGKIFLCHGKFILGSQMPGNI